MKEGRKGMEYKIEKLEELVLLNIENIFNNSLREYMKYNYENINTTMNRLLIFIQDKQATEVDTKENWIAKGRQVKHGALGIRIIIEKEKTKYRTDNIDLMGITAEEINKAIEFGIIEQEVIQDNVVGSVYDIRDTIIIDNETYEDYLSNIKRKTLKVSSLTEYIKIEGNLPNKETIESIERSLNGQDINNIDLEIKIIKMIDIIANTEILKLKSLGVTDNSLLDIIDKHLVVTLRHLYKIDSSDVKIGLGDIKINIEDMLNIVDYVNQVYNLIIKINYGEQLIDLSSQLDIEKRAERLLKVMEANIAYRRMKNRHI